MSEALDGLAGAPAVRAARQALGDREDVWIVGGALRDALLGRPVVDVDLAVAGGEEGAARQIARAAGGPAFPLSEHFDTWRAQSAGRDWHVDVTSLRGEGIEQDLGARDFTVNAIALPLAGGEPLDPHGGIRDVAARILRAASDAAFSDDPIRILRAARLAAALELEIDQHTAELARGASELAAEPAGERQLAELRAIVVGSDPMRGLRLLDELGATPVVLPELDALRGVEQNPYHHLDVHGHTIEVLSRWLEIERDLAAIVGPDLADEVGSLLDEPLADELTRRGGVRFAALFHDLGKPAVRRVNDDGRILFMGHDREGVEIVRAVCRRLRTSRRLSAYLESLTLNHLRLGFLVHASPLSRREVYDYLRATDPESVDVTLLTVADRLATQGERTRREAIDAHLDLAREMIAEALAWRRTGPPASPIRGDELASELGIEHGPELGRLIAEIEAAVFAGEVATRDDAIALAGELVAR
ncbi:MAG TPA: HD domain-containing protein [Solirubrobacterales bacterium]|nr:HD domain-containing protein [Solirubrobacterales bacterium]